MKPFVYCGGPFQTNAFAIQSGDKTVLFDAPEGVTEWLNSQQLKVDLLVLTHLHVDHILGLREVVDTFNCPIWAHSEPTEELTLNLMLSQITGMNWDLGNFSVGEFLSEEKPLKIGADEFEVLHIPGHSPDSLCFHNRNHSFVIGGDVLFQGSIGRTDFPNSSHSDLIAGIENKLLPLPDETIIYPGHGPETQIGFERAHNPYLRR